MGGNVADYKIITKGEFTINSEGPESKQESGWEINRG